MGERVNGIHEVGGSIPPGSTKFPQDCDCLTAALEAAEPRLWPLSRDLLDRILPMR